MKWTLKLELVDRASNLRSTVTGFKEPVGLPEAEGRFACHRMATRIMVDFDMLSS